MSHGRGETRRPLPGDLHSLDRQRWVLAKGIFTDALELPPADRSSFLARACAGDAGLAAEVASLLASDSAAGSFCEAPAATMLCDDTGSAAPEPARLPAGTRLGVYEIVEFVSAGGMGEVYRARHTLLDRDVALKTVAGDHADAAAGRRLVREARHASQLDHPNICTIFEVGDGGGTPFIAMEFVDGEPLSARLRTRAARLDEALALGIQVADALAHAHGHGIVHRDLKSSNVIVDPSGRAVVLDFGLARRLPGSAASADPTVTGPQALAGTLTHMAPEVLLGAEADARSDVWSLGVLLYELLTGTLPFGGRTPFETSSAILNDPPRRMPASVPLVLRLVVERCLCKEPEARYQCARDVREALERIQRRHAWPLVGPLLISRRRPALLAAAGLVLALGITGAVAAYLPGKADAGGRQNVSTLAFLPLENATGDRDVDYYAHGLTGGILEQLGALADVRIVSPGSAARAATSASARAEIGRRLGADAIVEGRLRQAGGTIIVDLRLVDPVRGRVIWSDSYERSERQVLALQADVVRAIATEVRLTLREDAASRSPAARTVNAEAYEAYLRGRFEWNRRTTESLRRAARHFERALELDPTYAPAYAALADCYNQFGTVMLGTGSPREYRPRAEAAAVRALQIDPWSAEAHAALGYVRHYDWQWAEAEQEFRTAIRLNPNYALAHLWYANLLMSRGRIDEALARVRVAHALDPFSLIVNTNVAWVLTAARRHDDAIAQLRQTLALDSTYVHAHWRLVGPMLATGRGAEALDAARRVVQLTGRSVAGLALLAEVRAATDDTAGARALLAEIMSRARAQYVSPASVAGIHEALGDREEQLRWLTRAVEERSNAIAYLRLDSGPWTADPRFKALAARAGLH